MCQEFTLLRLFTQLSGANELKEGDKTMSSEKRTTWDSDQQNLLIDQLWSVYCEYF